MNFDITWLILAFTLFVHNFLYFKQCSKIFKVRPNKKIFILPLCVINIVIIIGIILFSDDFIIVGYLSSVVVYLLELWFCFKVKPINLLVNIFSLMVHLISFQIITYSIVSIVTGVTLHEIYDNETFFAFIIIVSYIVNSLYILSTIVFLPKNNLKILNKDFFALRLLLFILVMSMIGLLTNVFMYVATPIDFQFIELVQIIIVLVWFSIIYSCTYIILGFEIMRESQSNYEKQLERASFYQDTLAKRVQVINEINCTKNRLTKQILHGNVVADYREISYTQHLERILPMVHEDYRDLVITTEDPKNFVENFNKGIDKVSYEYLSYTENNDTRWYNCVISISQDKATGDIIAINTISDIHEKKELELDLMYKSERDLLTGAYNKLATQNLITTHLNNLGVGIFFMIDLDNFKLINDNFGHAYGDTVLCDVFNKLKLLFRDSDILGRAGGDEFIVFMKDISDIKEGEQKAEKICCCIQNIYNNNTGLDIEISCSVGLTVAKGSDLDYKKLFNMADIAMYYSKDHGKNTYAVYDESVHKDYKSKRVVS